MKKLLLIIALMLYSITIAQSNWVQLNGPGGSNVGTIFKVTDSIYLAGVQFDGSFFRTTDAGANWAKVFQGNHPSNLGNKAVRCFAFNSNQEILASTFTSGILRSTDQGLTWIGTSGAGGEGMVNTNSGIMFGYDNVSQDWQFSRSLDSGKTWNYLPHPWTGNSVYSISSRNDIVYIGRRDSIIFSSDFGSTWNKYGNSFPASSIYSLIFLEENEALAGTNNGVFYTSDSGITWSLRNNGIPGSSKLIRNLQTVSDRIFGIGKTGLLYTTDKGINWNHFNNFNFQKDIYAAAYTDELILVATYAGVYRVIPEKWLYSSQGINGYNPGSIEFTSDSKLYYNTPAGLFRSSDYGINWEIVELDNFFGGCVSTTFKDNDQVIFAKSLLFYHSSDYGNTWINTGSSTSTYYNLKFSTLNNGIYGGFSYYRSGWPPSAGLNYSSDFGANWTYRTSSSPSFLTILKGDTLVGNMIKSGTWENLGMQISTNQGNNWLDMNTGLPDKSISSFAVDNFGDYYTSLVSGIYKASKSDHIWQQLTDVSMTGAISFNKLNHCLVIKNGKIYGSVNGENWDYCSEGIDDKSISKIIFDESGYFYLADNTGRLYKSIVPHIINKLPSIPELDYPNNNQLVESDTVVFKWYSSSPLVFNYTFNISTDSLFSNTIDTLTTDTTVSLTNLGANTKYYWKIKAKNEIGWGEESEIFSFITSLTDIDDSEVIIYNFSLSQNYPNPFNPSTSIQYAISSTQFVTLKVFDVLGREIATLVNEEKSAGSYEVEFNSEALNTTSLPSGVYFYQLRVGEYTSVKKMILLR